MEKEFYLKCAEFGGAALANVAFWVVILSLLVFGLSQFFKYINYRFWGKK